MAELPHTEKLMLQKDHGWLTIWFNSPENRNALSAQLSSELRQVLEAVHGNRSIRGITLRGMGGIFCAGGDLKGMNTHGRNASHQDVVKFSRAGGELFALINSMPQVVLALVEGAAIAGGLGITCCADVVAVTRDARFTLSETALGIPPAQIAPYVVQRLGLNTARRLMLTGARFSGAEAEQLGLADFIVENSAELDSVEAEIRKGVMRCAPNANAVTKNIVLKASRLSGEEMLDFAAEGFATCLLSEEGREGISSFIEKRKPAWAAKQDENE
jgi:isohexenylglutaconyl-CoA hydratase